MLVRPLLLPHCSAFLPSWFNPHNYAVFRKGGFHVEKLYDSFQAGAHSGTAAIGSGVTNSTALPS